MRRKGFLKKMIGALCVGVLISMPVTANAAEKEDVAGKWTYNSWGGTVEFKSDGVAEDAWNDGTADSAPYHMESGSVTTNYGPQGYDFWRGEGASPAAADGEHATLYLITGEGKMTAFNIVNNNGTVSIVGTTDMTKVKDTDKTDTGSSTESNKGSSTESNKSSNTSSGYKCEHHYEWTVTTEPTEAENGVSTYKCTSCGDIKAWQPVSADIVIRDNLLASIKNAEAGNTVTFDSKTWLCYPQYVLDTLKEKGDISLKTDFTYKGVNYSFTIPAGSDYSNLEQADFYGFMYLSGAFNGTVVE